VKRWHYLLSLVALFFTALFFAIHGFQLSAQEKPGLLELRLRQTFHHKEEGRQSVGGKVLMGNQYVGHYTSDVGIKQVETASLTTTIFFLDKKPPQNLTLQGIHDFRSGWQIGSVSAASRDYLSYIGKPFLYRGETVTIGD
jgi:hypothetical protein